MQEFINYRYNKNTVFIQQGEFFVTDDDLIIQTVLGSCISVCLFTGNGGPAGMNHFMLPQKLINSAVKANKYGLYGTYAMDLLMGEFAKKGYHIHQLKAAVYGGAVVMGNPQISTSNIEFIHTFLETEGIPIVDEDLGGKSGRNIQFFSRTNEIVVEKITKVDFKKIHENEKQWLHEFEKIFTKSTDIEIFK